MERSGRIKLLAVNALVITLLVLLLIGGGVAWFIGRPLGRVVDHTCAQIDAVKEAKAKHELQEREEEARMRALAEREIDQEFPSLADRPVKNPNEIH